MENDKLLLHSRKIIAIGICLLSILTVIFLYDFNRRTDYQVEAITQSYLMESANQGSDSIIRQINDRLVNLRFTADYLIQETDANARYEVMEKLMDNDHFNQFLLIDKENQQLAVSGIESSLADLRFYDSSLFGQEGISDVYQLESMNQKVISYYVPAFNNGELAGEFIATMSIEKIADTSLNTTFQSNAYYYVIAADGTMIQQSEHQDSLYDGRNYYDYLKSMDDPGITVDELQAMMMNNETGSFYLSIGSQHRYVYIRPLPINNWYLFTLVSSDNLLVQNEKLSKSAYYLTIKLVLTFICFFAAYYYLANRSYQGTIEAKRSVERSNRMFELALQHSFATMFEYDIQKDAAYFLKERNIKALCDYDSLCPFSKLVFENRCLNETEKEKLLEALSQMADGAEKAVFEISSGIKFDEPHWFRFTLAKLPSEADGKNILGIVEDISDDVRKRRQLEQEISMKEALFHEAISVWTLNLDSKIICSYTRDGMIQDAVEANYDEICLAMLKIVHEDDAKMVAEAMNFTNLKREFAEGREQRIEYRINRHHEVKDFIWVESVFSFYTLDNQTPMLLCYTMNINEEKRRRMELKFKSERDPLTGLYNRTAFEQLVNDDLNSLSLNQTAAFFMMDLDEFKLVNDTLGHNAGDELLMQVAYHLRDIRDHNGLCEISIARFGGDEFVAYLKGDKRQDVMDIAERILADIQNIKLPERVELRISVSIGIAFIDQQHHNFADLYESADQALYESKRSGKNRISIHN